MRTGPVNPNHNAPDLPDHYLPFLRLVLETTLGDTASTEAANTRLAEMTVEIVDHIAGELTPTFWKLNRKPTQDALQGAIFERLITSGLIEIAQSEALVDRLLDLARANHDRLLSAVNCLQVDDLRLELRRSARCKTLQITVDRGGELVLAAAPPEVDEDTLRRFVREKRLWIYTRLAEKAQLYKPTPAKRLVDGEGLLYLGRSSYRLKQVDGQTGPIKLINGRFCLRRELADAGRQTLIRWYAEQGKRWLWRKVQDYTARMEVTPTGVKVQDLGYRWGSCGKDSRLYFHWKTMLLPARIAEYVVVHELAHLHEPHHNSEFWQRVARTLADFESRKRWLAEHGTEMEGL